MTKSKLTGDLPGQRAGRLTITDEYMTQTRVRKNISAAVTAEMRNTYWSVPCDTAELQVAAVCVKRTPTKPIPTI